MSISTFKIKQCKLAPTVTVLCTHNFVCMNVCAKPFYVLKDQCMKIFNLASPNSSLIVTVSHCISLSGLLASHSWPVSQCCVFHDR